MYLGSSYDEGWRQSHYRSLWLVRWRCFSFFFLDSVGVRQHHADQNIKTSTSYVHQGKSTIDTNLLWQWCKCVSVSVTEWEFSGCVSLWNTDLLSIIFWRRFKCVKVLTYVYLCCFGSSLMRWIHVFMEINKHLRFKDLNPSMPIQDEDPDIDI